MSLEHLKSREPGSPRPVGDVRGFGLEVVEKREISESEKRYRELKESNLYNAQRELWRQYFDPSEKTRERIAVEEQFIALLIEMELNPQRARVIAEQGYQRLKELGFYDPNFNLWKPEELPYVNPGGTYNTQDALLALMIKTAFNPLEAKTDFISLLNSNAYDVQHELWGYSLMKERKDINYGVTAIQCLGIIAESLFDREAAEKKYIALKTSANFDKLAGLWKSFIGINRREFGINEQFAVVLVELIFEPEIAKKHYAALLASEFYNAELSGWNFLIEPGRSNNRNELYTCPQLYGILIQRRLEELEKSPQSLETKSPPQPEALIL